MKPSRMFSVAQTGLLFLAAMSARADDSYTVQDEVDVKTMVAYYPPAEASKNAVVKAFSAAAARVVGEIADPAEQEKALEKMSLRFESIKERERKVVRETAPAPEGHRRSVDTIRYVYDVKIRTGLGKPEVVEVKVKTKGRKDTSY